MAQEAGFDVNKADWLKHQARQTLKLSDEELEGVAGGRDGKRCTLGECCTMAKNCVAV
jgi:hypothetical protein